MTSFLVKKNMQQTLYSSRNDWHLDLTTTVGLLTEGATIAQSSKTGSKLRGEVINLSQR